MLIGRVERHGMRVHVCGCAVEGGRLRVVVRLLNGSSFGRVSGVKNEASGVVQFVHASFSKRSWTVSWIVIWVLIGDMVRAPIRTKRA